MATSLASPGIGTGLDVRSIVTQLLALERRPLDLLQTNTTRISNQLTSYGKLQSAMTTLRDAARKLADADHWSPSTVTSSNATAVSVSSDGSAPPGSYSVAVSRLAAAQTISTATSLPAATDSVGTGSLTIELGSWNVGQTAFTPKPEGTPTTLNIAVGSDSLEDVRDAINSAGAGAGVTASIVNDANGARLALRSTTTGVENGFRISVIDDDGDNADVAGLSQLAFDPESGASQMDSNLEAANATATINGVPISSATNTLTSVLDGLTLRLGQVTTADVDLIVERDNVAVRKNITDFAGAYNDMVKLLREQTRNDAGGTNNGALQGDSSTIGLTNQLRSLAGGSSAAATAFSRLADIGLAPQSDGTLKVDDSKLDKAMANLPELQTFFARDEAGSESDGFAKMFEDFGDLRLDSEGIFATRKASLQTRIDRNTDRGAQMENRLSLVEKRLYEQYTRLDTNIARLNQLQNYVTQQIANWNRSRV